MPARFVGDPQVDVALAESHVDVADAVPLVGNGRRASASRHHDETLTDSSPFFVLTTSPVAPTQSPSESFLNASNSPVQLGFANNWMRPVASCSTPKTILPWSRRSMRRPAA
jgi:hypothetical protein